MRCHSRGTCVRCPKSPAATTRRWTAPAIRRSCKTLSEALSIMARMCQDQHIDHELFELFLSSGVYRDYARRFMPADQIDEVKVGDCL